MRVVDNVGFNVKKQDIPGGGSGSGGGRPLATPDYLQNDETAADYIKNRPFYSEYEERYIFENKSVSIENVNEGVSIYDKPELPILVGESYKVTWDGVEYNCTAYLDEHKYLIIGNAELWGGSGGNNEPFLIADSSMGFYLIVGEAGEHTFSIYGQTEIITKLPEKYFPERIKPLIVRAHDTTEEILIEAFNRFEQGYPVCFQYRKNSAVLPIINMGGDPSYAAKPYYTVVEKQYTNASPQIITCNYHKDESGNWIFEEPIQQNALVLKSSTAGSTKNVIIKVDDSGTISTTVVD